MAETKRWLYQIDWIHAAYLHSTAGLHEKNRWLTTIAVKLVDDVLFDGEAAEIDTIITVMKCQFRLGTVLYGPGGFFSYGLQFEKDSIIEIVIDADQKLNTLES